MADCHMPDIGHPVQIPSFDKFARPGIYFLHRDREIIYVGQAVDMRRRIGSHMAEATKSFDGVSCIACSVDSLTNWERYFIAALTPRDNQCSFTWKARKYSADRWAETAIGDLLAKPPCLSSDQAASFLCLGVDQLDRLGDEGPAYIMRRVGRDRGKARGYFASDLVAYARSNRHQDARIAA